MPGRAKSASNRQSVTYRHGVSLAVLLLMVGFLGSSCSSRQRNQDSASQPVPTPRGPSTSCPEAEASWSKWSTLSGLAIHDVFALSRCDLLFVGEAIGAQPRGVILRSSDGGRSFEQVVRLPGATLSAILFRTSSSGWVAGSDGEGRGLVLRTTDGGRDWDRLDVPDDVTEVTRLALGPDGSLWAGARSSGGSLVMKTEDEGMTWSVELEIGGLGLTALAVSQAGVAAAATDGMQTRVFVADRGTAGFRELDIASRLSNVNDLAWSANSGLFAAGYLSESGRIEEGEALILRSEDGGRTWRSSYRGGGVQILDLVSPEAGTIYALLTAVTGSAVLRTDDDGAHWQSSVTGAGGGLLERLSVADEVVVAVGSAGLYAVRR